MDGVHQGRGNPRRADREDSRSRAELMAEVARRAAVRSGARLTPGTPVHVDLPRQRGPQRAGDQG